MVTEAKYPTLLEETHIAAIAATSKHYTRPLKLLYSEVQMFPATLSLLTEKVISSDLQTKDDLVATGSVVFKKLLIDQWDDTYKYHINNLMEGLWNIRRWENYQHIGGPENGLQHSLRDLHLVVLLSEFERLEGGSPDLSFLFPSFILHDIGEIGIGDTLYKDKSLDRELEEYRQFCRLTSFLSPQEQEKWKYYYLGQYIRFSPEVNQQRFKEAILSPLPILGDLQQKYSYEGKIFDAAERLGYLLYAVHCFADCHQIEPLIQVLRNQHQHLIRLASNLQSIGKYIYSPDIQVWASELLQLYQNFYLEK